jgi:hypothetical protein
MIIFGLPFADQSWDRHSIAEVGDEYVCAHTYEFYGSIVLEYTLR